MTSLNSYEKPGLKEIPGVQPLYFLPEDPFVEEVLIRGFLSATAVDTMVGFFSSQGLRSLAPGLATFINQTEGTIRLVMSPIVQKKDGDALEEAVVSAEQLAEDFLEDFILTQDLIEQHTLKCLAWLIKTNRLEIKIAIMKGALFHPKVWLFRDSEDEILAAHGSSNMTLSALQKNFEQIAVSKSWSSPEQRYTTEKLSEQFLNLWSNSLVNCTVLSLPEAVKQRLLKNYESDQPPTEEELQGLFYEEIEGMDEFTGINEVNRDRFRIPTHLEYQSGPFAHQGEAVEAWCEAGHNGVLEMATGSGKTITSMICAYKLFEFNKPLLIVVAAPYIPLIEQWCDEIKEFGISPVNITEAVGPRGRARELAIIRRGFRSKEIDVAVIVVSHSTLSNRGFQAELQKFQCKSLLIADEAHNLGSEGFIRNTPDFFDFRLGLSATPVRQYDEEGTEAIFDFLGSVVYRYTLEQAIGNCLVEYDYYVHPVSLTQSEMDQWHEITTRIRQNSWRQENGDPDDFLTKLFRDRRVILETAENKIVSLEDCLKQERGLRHTLIYASDKAPEQLEAVNALLKEQRIMFQQVTYEETADRKQTRRILDLFKEGSLSCLTAKRVLDEGVNIPQIQKAFILASTTVERQWVQRRGRLLRKCSEIGKTHSVIHDFVVLPPDMEEPDDDARKLVRSELIRIQEFARLSRNAGRPDGPLPVIDDLVRVAYL